MDPEILKQLPSAVILAGLATFLVRWLATSVMNGLAEIRAAMVTSQLTMLEFYRLLLVHDSQCRGVNPTAGKDLDDAHKLAFEEYQKISDSLDNLKETISRNNQQK